MNELLPTLKQLRHFVALAEHRHFGKAAVACFVTQSTLSASLRELEGILQAPLVDRTKRQVVLTPLGEEILGRARKLLEEARDLTLAAQTAREPLSGTVRLGVIPTIGPFLLPRILPGLRRDYPKLKLYLREEQTAQLVAQLHNGHLDVLLIALPWNCGNVESAVLFNDRFSLALPKNHPLAKQRKVEASAARKETLLLLEDGHCLRDHALSACRIGPKPHAEAFEATSLPTLVQMAANGLGVTLLPELAVDAGILTGSNLVTRPLAVDEPWREIALVWRKGTGRREEFQLLAKEIRKLAKNA